MKGCQSLSTSHFLGALKSHAMDNSHPVAVEYGNILKDLAQVEAAVRL
jgi:hypothetical protein